MWRDNPEANVAAVWSMKAQQPVRVALDYGGAWRPIFWIEFGKDGSIYLGPRYEKLTYRRKGSKAGEGGVTIGYDEGDSIPRESLKGGRVTFHPSGLVNPGPERL
jgi:hypothetical protein